MVVNRVNVHNVDNVGFAFTELTTVDQKSTPYITLDGQILNKYSLVTLRNGQYFKRNYISLQVSVLAR